MLSRTADHLFWMARYMERAENTARMLDANYQASLLPQSADGAQATWRGLLGISALTEGFMQRHGEVSAANVMKFMVCDETHASSILSCLRAARENARAVRGVLTTEVWETENSTWLGFCRLLSEGAFERDPASVFEWLKMRAHLSRGVRVGTMPQNEALHFLRIGTFLERADNTARLLDVKLHGLDVAATARSRSGRPLQELDYYYWSAVLRSVSAFEVYRKVYRHMICPEKVAELLILRPDMPRSLLSCVNQLVDDLARVANDRSEETLRRAGQMQSDLRYGRIDEIMETGLHAYLSHFLNRVADLGVSISRSFLMPVPA